jgi:hypothetical protein
MLVLIVLLVVSQVSAVADDGVQSFFSSDRDQEAKGLEKKKKKRKDRRKGPFSFLCLFPLRNPGVCSHMEEARKDRTTKKKEKEKRKKKKKKDSFCFV